MFDLHCALGVLRRQPVHGGAGGEPRFIPMTPGACKPGVGGAAETDPHRLPLHCREEAETVVAGERAHQVRVESVAHGHAILALSGGPLGPSPVETVLRRTGPLLGRSPCWGLSTARGPSASTTPTTPPTAALAPAPARAAPHPGRGGRGVLARSAPAAPRARGPSVWLRTARTSARR